MPSFDFPIRTKLAIWAALGVLLVAGMLTEQQVGDRWAEQQRAIAQNRQLAAVEALRAAKDLGDMQIEMREMRLAIVGADIDRALARLRADAIGRQPAYRDRDRSDRRDRRQDSNCRRSTRSPRIMLRSAPSLPPRRRTTAIRSPRFARLANLGRQMNVLIEQATEDLISAAEDRDAQAGAERRRVSRIDLGIGLFVIAVLAGLAVFGALAIAVPIRRIGEVLRELAQGNKNVEVPYRGRTDEVGDNARAAQAFKEKLLRVEQLEIAEKEMAQRMAEQRRADMHGVAGRVRDDRRQRRARRCRRRRPSLKPPPRRSARWRRRRAICRDKVLSASTQAADNVQSVSHRHRTAHRVGRRDQPAGPGIDAHRPRGGGAGRADRRPHRRIDARRRPHRRRRQADHRHRRANKPAGAQRHDRGGARRRRRARALRWSRRRSRRWRRKPRRRPTRSACRSPACRRRRRTPSAASRRSAAPSPASPRSPTPSPPRSNCRRRRRARSPSNVAAATGSAAHVAANLGEVNHSASGITSASAQILASAKSLSREGSRLTAEMEKLLTAVRAA